MSKPITGKTTTSVWKQKRKNGDIYVWERQTVYIPETRKTKELSRKLLGKIPAGSTDGEIVPTRPKRKKTEDAVWIEISALPAVYAKKPARMTRLRSARSTAKQPSAIFALNS